MGGSQESSPDQSKEPSKDHLSEATKEQIAEPTKKQISEPPKEPSSKTLKAQAHESPEKGSAKPSKKEANGQSQSRLNPGFAVKFASAPDSFWGTSPQETPREKHERLRKELMIRTGTSATSTPHTTQTPTPATGPKKRGLARVFERIRGVVLCRQPKRSRAAKVARN
ncbi:MAG: hypothetical protein Q9162_005338 [Coniocarpon cinnabarinum]